MKNPPTNIDVLLLEGTTIGRASSKDGESEKDLVQEFLRVFKRTKGAAFVTMAGQNIDRFVTVFKAARKTNRLLVIDPYVAEVLDRARKAAKHAGRDSRLPHPTWKDIKVCYPQQLCRWLENQDNGKKILDRHRRPNGVNWESLSRNQARIVMIARTSTREEIFSRGYFDLSQASWVYSLWKGYLKPGSDLQTMKDEFKKNGTAIEEIHTSGHATVSTLKKFVGSLNPHKVIPVHTEQPASYKDLMENVITMEDGTPLTI
ncbi:MAG: MBL fold metallo-hydrolase RNA specificity domain-containing protein [Nitrospirota bacterium]